jgi:hypothetical protein
MGDRGWGSGRGAPRETNSHADVVSTPPHENGGFGRRAYPLPRLFSEEPTCRFGSWRWGLPALGRGNESVDQAGATGVEAACGVRDSTILKERWRSAPMMASQVCERAQARAESARRRRRSGSSTRAKSASGDWPGSIFGGALRRDDPTLAVEPPLPGRNDAHGIIDYLRR